MGSPDNGDTHTSFDISLANFGVGFLPLCCEQGEKFVGFLFIVLGWMITSILFKLLKPRLAGCFHQGI
jgi:predicted membrane channel-forming protein YqfA (hemolysin III family)